MELFKVAPYDQHLFLLNGGQLTDSDKTLGELKVLPRSLIYLRADEPGAACGAGGGAANGTNGVASEEPWSASHPEEGFKGTGLLSGF